VSITFRPEPDARSRAVIDCPLECVVEPRRDRRSFATYGAAVAGLAGHAQFCAEALCFPETPYIASRRPWDDEPAMNVSTVNGALVLRALGLVPELGAAAVRRARPARAAARPRLPVT
jgi:hypothetical protein